MQRTDFDARRLPSETRWRAWHDALAAFAIDAEAPATDRFEGRVRSCVAPSGLSFTVLESAAPQTLAAAPGLAGEVFWLAMALAGDSRLDIGGERAEMRPGDILYGKKGAPCALEISTEFRMLLVNMPANVIARRVLLPLPNRAIRLSGQSGMGRIFSGLLAAIAEAIDDLDETLTGPIEAAIPQFLLTSLFGEAGEPPLGGNAAARAGLLQRIWQTIELRLDDPDLSVAEVAQAHGLSVRYVQKLFEESGQNFSRYVRRRRLEQCRAELANPLNADISITTTCFQWGFNDSATFSRAFREEFGVSPRDYRRERQPARPAARLRSVIRTDA